MAFTNSSSGTWSGIGEGAGAVPRVWVRWERLTCRWHYSGDSALNEFGPVCSEWLELRDQGFRLRPIRKYRGGVPLGAEAEQLRQRLCNGTEPGSFKGYSEAGSG